MGCDIHLVLERKSGDKWIAVDTFKGHEAALDKGYAWPAATSRNYERFAALAGVRGSGPAACGLPTDPSDTTQLLLEDWGSDAHSISWLPLNVAAQIFLRTDRNPSEFARKYPDSHFFGVDQEERGAAEYRLVFWFDN